MFVEERHQEILQLLKENEKVKVKELSERFQVTDDCIRKDLASLEAKNLLKRTYGGAVLKDALHPGHSNSVSTRKNQNIKEKIKIAKKAVKLIHNGDMIFLDTSTTNIELAKEIIDSGLDVTVVSCMMDIAAVFSNSKNVKFILIGGEFNRSQNGFLGPLTLQMMNNFRFDICFMGVVGANVEENIITTYVPDDGLMKSSVVERSSKVYLGMESKKFEFQANYVYTTFSQIDGIICEKIPSREIQDQLGKYNVEII
ncbi:DeoR/GlpR family DNA-binding transcription regulator [Anaerostipes faecalis]|uniref:DeoR/GlpR family DNA-binding transcription regulator n=1 Tax=Anaerostipes faecalis TaxID=2738446 RepID=UPI001C1E06F5|nr:DeoR/GlpR family DNA-binding transcription regulator [Anaerostipes faecalis]